MTRREFAAPRGGAVNPSKPEPNTIPVHNRFRIEQHRRGRSPVRSNDQIKPDGVAGRRAVGSEAMRKRKSGGAPPLEFVAGNGLLHRRALLQSGVMFAGALGSGASLTSAAAEPLTEPEWSLYPGAVTPVLQTPSKYEKDVVRTLSNPKGDARTQHARAPLQKLNGTVTPNALHFTINHSGIPDIDPDKHVLVVHGMVKQPLEFTIDALLRYPMVTRKHFVECGGNSAPMFSPEPIQAPLQALHGLVSCAEWTGVPVSTLLDEAGVDPKATWMLAEGADSLAVSRSVPLKKAYDDAIVALYESTNQPLVQVPGRSAQAAQAAIVASRLRTTNELYREAVAFGIEATGAHTLNLKSMAEDLRRVTLHLGGGSHVSGRILQMDHHAAGYTVVMKMENDHITVVPYHAIERIDLA